MGQDPDGQVPLHDDRHERLLRPRDRGELPGARASRRHSQLNTTRSCSTLPPLSDGNPVNDPLRETERRGLAGRLHQVAVHDNAHMGRVPAWSLESTSAYLNNDHSLSDVGRRSISTPQLLRDSSKTY